jgi:hypothetical protein
MSRVRYLPGPATATGCLRCSLRPTGVCGWRLGACLPTHHEIHPCESTAPASVAARSDVAPDRRKNAGSVARLRRRAQPPRAHPGERRCPTSWPDSAVDRRRRGGRREPAPGKAPSSNSKVGGPLIRCGHVHQDDHRQTGCGCLQHHRYQRSDENPCSAHSSAELHYDLVRLNGDPPVSLRMGGALKFVPPWNSLG